MDKIRCFKWKVPLYGVVHITRISVLTLIACSLLTLYYINQEPTHLSVIKDRGVLKVGTRNSATTYYWGADGPTGYEYEFAKRFAKFLGVTLEINAPDDIDSLETLLKQGAVDLVATGIPSHEKDPQFFRLSHSYQTVKTQLMVKQGLNKNSNLHSLTQGKVVSLSENPQVHILRQMEKSYPNLSIEVTQEMNTEELFQQLTNETIDYAFTYSNEVKQLHRFYPELRIAQTYLQEHPLQWLILKTKDTSLYDQVQAFIKEIEEDGTLTQLYERFYGHIEQFNYAGNKIFLDRLEKRLPKYERLFRNAAVEYGLDWQLLAAIGHQESGWNPKAISPTGVRGLMMLTLATAKQVGIKNRLDPKQSIYGGAKYFAQLYRRLPENITEPDRTWMTLAAYNVGLGHLYDAQKITLKRGKDPTIWSNVKESLPLLSQKRWYRQTKHGYARGSEPVRYVLNVRRYYEILSWQENQAFLQKHVQSKPETDKPTDKPSKK